MYAPSGDVTTPGSPTDEMVPTAGGLYRLYDRWWIGVSAIVSSLFFPPGVNVET